MKIKNIFKKRPSKFTLLKEEVSDLKERIFSKKEETKYDYCSRSWFPMFNYEPIPLEEEISILQDKLDVIAKHLGLTFEEKQKKDKEWTVKPIKVVKKVK